MRNNQPSKTAELAAMMRAAAFGPIGASLGMIQDPYARLFVGPRLLPAFLATRLQLRLQGAAALKSGMNSVGFMFALVRHQFIESLFLGALNQGIGQVIILGAGYDTKCLRYRDRAGFHLFEIDQTATSKRKRAIIDTTKFGTGSTEFIACDLALQSPDIALDRSGFDRKKPVLIIAEGVLSYLAAPRVHGLLHELSCIADSVKIVFDYRYPAVATDSGVVGTWRRSFAKVNEAYKSFWTAQDMARQVTDTGFSVVDNRNLASVWAERFPAIPVAPHLEDIAGVIEATRE